MPDRSRPTIIQGLILSDPATPPEPGYLTLDAGRIKDVAYADHLPSSASPPDLGSASHVICPAFIDAHFHVPQVDSVGCDGLPLLEWLDRVIYPAESWWGRGAAVPATRTALRRLAREGTVGVAAYLTSHGTASAEALRLLARSPLRVHAGRVAMDRSAPDELTAEDRRRAQSRPVSSPVLASLDAAEAGRTSVSANPRFAVSCSDELLAEIGWLVRERAARGAPIVVQTHLAESLAECTLVRTLFGGDSYAQVYDRFGLLTDRTLLAHCLHLSQEEWALLASRTSIAVHCPGANMFLRSGVFDWRSARDHGVRVALGSDIAAGPDVAMPRVARAMIETAKLRAMTLDPAAPIPTPAQAWSMITRGNADLLGWSDSGRVEPGAAADLLVLRVPELWRDEHMVSRLIYNWSPELIEARVFAGRLVDPATMTSTEGGTSRAI